MDEKILDNKGLLEMLKEVKNELKELKENDPVETKNVINEVKNELKEGLWKVYSKEIKEYTIKSVGVESSATLGLNIVPALGGNSLYTSPNEFGIARRISNVININGRAQEFYYSADLSASAHAADNTSSTGSNFVFNKITLTPTRYSGNYVFSKELEQDAVFNLTDEARKNFVKVLNGHEDALLVSKLEALPNANTLTASVTGSISASLTSLDIFPQLIGMVESQNANYENGAFLANPSVYWYFYGLKKTTGDPMINFDTSTQTLFVYGKPFYKTNKMAGASTTTSGKTVLVYGDFSKAYFGDRGVYTVSISTDGTQNGVNLWENDLVGVKASERVAIELIDNNAFAGYELK